jgi:hypothetical protein
MVETLPSMTKASKVVHADGTSAYSGSLSFDVTTAAMGLFTTSGLFGRYYPFDVGIHDGTVGYTMTGCKATSVSVSGVAGGLVSASVSFVGKTGFQSGVVSNNFIRDETTSEGALLGYWWSGAKSTLKAKSWTFLMSQEVTPVYGNESGMEPLYVRVGLVEYTLEVESYTQLAVGESDTVYIQTKTFALTGNTNERGFQYNGVTELGTYRYVFGTGTVTGASDGTVLSIT